MRINIIFLSISDDSDGISCFKTLPHACTHDSFLCHCDHVDVHFYEVKAPCESRLLRELKVLVQKLYGLGDFTSVDPARKLLEAKVNGFIQGGLLIEVVSAKGSSRYQ